jgi:hypothetical protein
MCYNKFVLCEWYVKCYVYKLLSVKVIEKFCVFLATHSSQVLFGGKKEFSHL